MVLRSAPCVAAQVAWQCIRRASFLMSSLATSAGLARPRSPQCCPLIPTEFIQLIEHQTDFLGVAGSWINVP